MRHAGEKSVVLEQRFVKQYFVCGLIGDDGNDGGDGDSNDGNDDGDGDSTGDGVVDGGSLGD